MAENDLRQFIKEEGEETRRHFDVVAEDLKSDIQTVAEQVGANAENIEIIKQDISIIKNDLKQKVDRDEFVALERRVGMLETKLRPT